MQEPKILFFLAVWKRPEITELCFMGLQRLMKRGSVQALAVISEDSMIPLCKKYGINFIMHENEPLGKKKNAGLNAAMKMDFDYLIELGSDDVILDDIFEVYKPLMDRGEDFFGSNRLLFVDTSTATCRDYIAEEAQYGYGWGLGRVMSKKMLEKFGGKTKIKAFTGIFAAGEVIGEGTESFVPKHIAISLAKEGYCEILQSDQTYYLWSDSANRMLDNDSSKRIAEHGFIYKPVETDHSFMADLKTEENIWGYNPEIGKKGDFEKFLKGLTQAERSAYFAAAKRLKAKRIETAA